MDRFIPPSNWPRSSWRLTALLAAAILVAQCGCTKLLATAFYVIRGTDTPAEFKGLKDKKVVVVCRPLTELNFSCSNAATELATEVSRKLQLHMKRKITVIDQDEVANWTDENSFEDYTEIGRALDADMVVGIDMLSFNTLLGQTLLQGKSQVKVTVFDMSQDGKRVYEKQLPQIIFPENNGVSTQDLPETQFRYEFVKVVADEIGSLFYASDRYARYNRSNPALSTVDY